MNLKELTSPISAYWDIDQASLRGAAFHLNICEELIKNKVLTLHLTEGETFLSSECLSVMDRLTREPIAVSLTVSPEALNAESLGLLQNWKPRALLVKAASLVGVQRVADLRREAGALTLGVSIEVTKHNVISLPEILAFCIAHKIVNIVLPMQRLTNNRDAFCLSAAERLEMAAALKKLEKLESLKIVIHDPFLWRAFYPSVVFPEGGCRAANTMLYLSPEADVYPCPSLSIKLGSLLKESFREIVLSQKKKDLRKVLAVPPGACGDCYELSLCLGGCRGRAYRMTGSLSEPDPACR